MKFVGKVLSIIFAFLGAYTCLLGSQAETASRVEEICSFSCVFWLPALLFWVLSLTKKEA
jgi:hypothetical protein